MSIYMMAEQDCGVEEVQIFSFMRAPFMNAVISREFGDGWDLRTQVCSDVETRVTYDLIDGHFFSPKIMLDVLDDPESMRPLIHKVIAMGDRHPAIWEVFEQHVEGFRQIAEACDLKGCRMGWL